MEEESFKPIPVDHDLFADKVAQLSQDQRVIQDYYSQWEAFTAPYDKDQSFFKGGPEQSHPRFRETCRRFMNAQILRIQQEQNRDVAKCGDPKFRPLIHQICPIEAARFLMMMYGAQLQKYVVSKKIRGFPKRILAPVPKGLRVRSELLH